MTSTVNKILVVGRISGSVEGVIRVTEKLCELGGHMTSRPEKISASVLPDAWWALEVSECDQESTEPAIRTVLDRLNGLSQEIIYLMREFDLDLEIDCAVEIYSERPILEVSRNSVVALSVLGGALGFEIYDYRE